MNPQLIAALVAANIIAEGDAEDVILTKIGGVKLATENDTSALDAANALIAAANEQLTALQSEIRNSQSALVSARTAAANSALDLAVTSGRLVEADRETKRGELLGIENTTDFATALTTLVTAAPVIKTQTVTAALGKEGKQISAANESNAKGAQRRALVEKCKDKFPNLTGSALHDAAWNAARAAEPGLF